MIGKAVKPCLADNFVSSGDFMAMLFELPSIDFYEVPLLSREGLTIKEGNVV